MAAMPDGRVEVRSYRTVFDLERRLYRIDRIRLNPGGIPVRAVVYGVALALAIALVAALPLAGRPLTVLPWPVRELALPCLLAGALAAIRVDGRPCHVAARSLISLALGPRRLSGWRRAPAAPERWRPPDILLIPDGSDARPRRARFTGPGAVSIAVAHQLRRRRGRRVTLRADDGWPGRKRTVIVLARRARLDVRPRRRS